MDQRTIDAHSVTCHHCGELADERETFRLAEGELCPKCINEHPELLPLICSKCGWEKSDEPPLLCSQCGEHEFEHSAWQ